MTRKSRLALLIVAAAVLPMISACSESLTGPNELKIRKDATYDSLVAMGCGEVIPWGKAPCNDTSHE